MASPKNRKKPGVLDNVERYRPSFNRWEKVKPLPKRCYSPGKKRIKRSPGFLDVNSDFDGAKNSLFLLSHDQAVNFFM